jgi:deferrochelatase/peroxidase EfeB
VLSCVIGHSVTFWTLEKKWTSFNLLQVDRASHHSVYETRRETVSVYMNYLRIRPLLYRTSVRCTTGAFSTGVGRSLNRHAFTYDKGTEEDSGLYFIMFPYPCMR